jgi:hypothetical protein
MIRDLLSVPSMKDADGSALGGGDGVDEAVDDKGGDESGKVGGGDEDDESKDTKDVRAPEKYEFQLPEGVTMDEGLLKSAGELFKQHDVSQEAAQAILDMQIGIRKSEADALAADVAKWHKETVEDKEFGGDKFKANSQIANRVISQFGGTPEEVKMLRAMFDATGLGNHPLLFKTFARIGAKIQEDKLADRQRSGGEKKTPEQKFYGSTAARGE